jgi:hypothetical protein
MQKPGEISDITKRLRWTDSQVEAISALGIGQAMIEVGLNRQTFEVTYSPAEYEMANTDPRLDTVSYIGRDGRSDAPDDLAGNPASVRAGRAGGDLRLAGRSQTDLPLTLV